MSQNATKARISVVMVTRNVEPFLAEAIQSILDQTVGDLEFVIVDYGSTDQTKAITARYAASDSRIRLHEIATCGLAEARNFGCFQASGEYIAIMDADDVALPDRLARQLQFMTHRPAVALLGGGVEWIDRGGRTLRVIDVPTEDGELREALRGRCPFWQPTVVFRKAAFVAVGAYRSAFAPAEDYDLWLRMAETAECANLAETLVKYRIHPHQVSLRRRAQQSLCILAAQTSAAARRNQERDPFADGLEITAEALSRCGVSEQRRNDALARDYETWVRHMCMAQEYESARKAAQEILRTDLAGADSRTVSDLHLTLAGLEWRKGQFFAAARAACHGVRIRPCVIGRPFKHLVQFAVRSWDHLRMRPGAEAKPSLLP